MHNYQNLLVAIDFSEHSELALNRAKQLAQVYNANLKVIHITEVPSYPVLEDVAITGVIGVWDEVSEKLLSAATKRLQAMLKQVGLESVDCEVIAGIPRAEIVNHARQMEADLIVIGRRGVSGLSRLIGSTADSVLHDAPCDVLAVNLE